MAKKISRKRKTGVSATLYANKRTLSAWRKFWEHSSFTTSDSNTFTYHIGVYATSCTPKRGQA